MHLLAHAVDLAADRRVLDVANYEGARTAFWNRFRPGYYIDQDYRRPATTKDPEAAVRSFENRTGRRVDYVLVVGDRAAPADRISSLFPGLWSEFDVEQSGRSRHIYLLRRRVRAAD